MLHIMHLSVIWEWAEKCHMEEHIMKKNFTDTMLQVVKGQFSHEALSKKKTHIH